MAGVNPQPIREQGQPCLPPGVGANIVVAASRATQAVAAMEAQLGTGTLAKVTCVPVTWYWLGVLVHRTAVFSQGKNAADRRPSRSRLMRLPYRTCRPPACSDCLISSGAHLHACMSSKLRKGSGSSATTYNAAVAAVYETCSGKGQGLDVGLSSQTGPTVLTHLDWACQLGLAPPCSWHTHFDWSKPVGQQLNDVIERLNLFLRSGQLLPHRERG